MTKCGLFSFLTSGPAHRTTVAAAARHGAQQDAVRDAEKPRSVEKLHGVLTLKSPFVILALIPCLSVGGRSGDDEGDEGRPGVWLP